MMKAFFSFLLPVALCANLLAQPAFVPAPRVSVSEHSGKFNGHDITYTARVKETFLYGMVKKKPFASVILTSYVLNEPRPAEGRPVVFIFNGGPGASSSPLHMGAFGPFRLQWDGTKHVARDNPNSLLDAADLVFVDPPGTGFTRVFDMDSSKRFWEVKGDAAMVVDLVSAWLKENGRERGPVFLCGESYGTMRAATVMGMAGALPLKGVVMLSAFLDMTALTDAPGNDMPYVLTLPTMACLAVFHHKVEANGRAVERVFSDAADFAAREYAPILFRGHSTTLDERKEFAKKLSAVIGLPDTLLLSHDLRVSVHDFERSLLADKDLRIGQLDGQLTGPLHAPAQHPPFDDPSFNRTPSNKAQVADYFRTQLNFPDTGSYKTINFEVNAKWDWSALDEEYGGYRTVAPYAADALNARKDLKLMVAGGYYDLATPLYAAPYSLDHAGAPASRISYARFPTGHSIFEQPDELAKLSNRVRTFLKY
jgi:carboxypeptidase C (cathepsin A)